MNDEDSQESPEETRTRLLEEYRSALEELERANERVKTARARVAELYREREADRNRTGGKPNARVYEEILRDRGGPMHAADICRAALQRGVRLRGTRNPPVLQVRNALMASKRFVNVGNNTWRLG